MRKLLVFSLAALTVFAAENAWDKVRDLRTGIEVRIIKKGTRKPILGIMDEANDERIIVVVKHEEIAIQKDDIDRIDYRPPGTGKASKETRTTQSSETTPVGPAGQGAAPGPSTSTSTTLSSGSKPDFETIYRRTVK